jgi:hypothetical protein
MKQTRLAVCAIKRLYYLDVYVCPWAENVKHKQAVLSEHRFLRTVVDYSKYIGWQ